VLHYEKTQYEMEILEILRLNGGEITGFNELLNKRSSGRSFHPTRTATALKKLEKEGEIKIEETGFAKQKKYILIEHNIEKAYDKLTKKLQKIEIQFNSPNLKEKEKVFLTSNYLRLGLHKLTLLKLLQLSNQILEIKKSKLDSYKKLEEMLFQDLHSKFNELSIQEKHKTFQMTWNFEKEPTLWSLQKYREWFHKPTAKEKREEKITIKIKQKEDFEKNPFCNTCGDKQKDYESAEKHVEHHMKEFEKGFTAIYTKYGMTGFCTSCGKKLPKNQKSAEKHLLSHEE